MNNMEDKKNDRLFKYLMMVGDYESNDGFLFLDNDNNTNRILVQDLLTVISDVIRDGITLEVQREVLNKLEILYHQYNKYSIKKSKNP